MKIHINCPSCESDIKISMKNSDETGDISCPYCQNLIHIGDDIPHVENQQLEQTEPVEVKNGSDLGFDPAQLLMRGIQSVTPAITNWEAPTVEELNDSLEERYNIISILGRGGMGAVYKATDTRLSRSVAIKILPIELGENEEAVSRFEREAKALAALDHPNIINIHDYGQTDEGHIYFVMEFIEGNDLQQLRKSGDIDLSSALDIVSQVCAALDFAHSKGIIHRDIKPANVLVGNDGRVKVADFGLAKTLTTQSRQQVDPTITASGTAMGTPDYMAPEQKEGQRVDHRADIYALGVMLYDLLTGAPPRGAWSAPSQRLEIDIRLDQIIIKSLQEDPVERYQSVDDVKSDIDSVKASTGGEPIPVGAAVEPLPSTMRRPSGIARARTAPNNLTTRVFDSSDHTQAQAEHTSNMDAIVQTTKSTNKTMLLLGTFAILTIGAIAIYVGAFKKDGDTYNTVNNTSYQEIQNNYFSQIIVNGTTTKKDLEMVQGIKPYGTLFVGISKELLTLTEAQDLAKRTGSTILDYTTSQPNKPAPLNLWLRSSFSLKQKAWVKIHSQHQVINSKATLGTAVAEGKYYVLLSWQGPKELMMNAEGSYEKSKNERPTKEKFLHLGSLRIIRDLPEVDPDGYYTLFNGETIFDSDINSSLFKNAKSLSYSDKILEVKNSQINFLSEWQDVEIHVKLKKDDGRNVMLGITNQNGDSYAATFYGTPKYTFGLFYKKKDKNWNPMKYYDYPDVQSEGLNDYFDFKYTAYKNRHSIKVGDKPQDVIINNESQGAWKLWVRSTNSIVKIKEIRVKPIQKRAKSNQITVTKGIPKDALEFDGHYYKFYPSQKNWEEALKECQARGGRLAVADSLSKFRLLASLVGSGHAYIGINNKKDGKRWRWLNDQPIRQDLWAWQQPQNPDVNPYVNIHKGFLYSIPVKSNHVSGYLCEWTPEQAAQVPTTSATAIVNKAIKPQIPKDAARHNGSAYVVYEAKENWYSAQEHCRKLGGKLVIINNNAEHQFLTQLLDKNGFNNTLIWLGASNLNPNNSWLWLDGSSVNKSNTFNDTLIPNRYLSMKNGVFSAKENSSSYGNPFICEWNVNDSQNRSNTAETKVKTDDTPETKKLPNTLTITNKKGKSLKVEILSATDTHIKVQRLSDNKEFSIKLNTLSKKDQDFIKNWLQQKQPTTPSKKANSSPFQSTNYHSSLKKFETLMGSLNKLLPQDRNLDPQSSIARNQKRVKEKIILTTQYIDHLKLKVDKSVQATKTLAYMKDHYLYCLERQLSILESPDYSLEQKQISFKQPNIPVFPEKGKVLNEIPQLHQQRNYCVPTSAAMVARYFGKFGDQDALAKTASKDSERHRGTGSGEIYYAMRRIGLSPEWKSLTPTKDDLLEKEAAQIAETSGFLLVKGEIDKDRPVLIFGKNGRRKVGHAVLAVGYEDSEYGQFIYIRDPAGGGDKPVRKPMKVFSKFWADYNKGSGHTVTACIFKNAPTKTNLDLFAPQKASLAPKEINTFLPYFKSLISFKKQKEWTADRIFSHSSVGKDYDLLMVDLIPRDKDNRGEAIKIIKEVGMDYIKHELAQKRPVIIGLKEKRYIAPFLVIGFDDQAQQVTLQQLESEESLTLSYKKLSSMWAIRSEKRYSVYLVYFTGKAKE